MAEQERGAGVTVVVPTLNEAENLERLVPRITAALGATGLEFEVVIADDDSPDGTADVAARLGETLPLRVIRPPPPRSLAAAVVAAARTARHACVAVCDADLSHDPAELPRLIEPVVAGAADVAIASRYVEGGQVSGWPAQRRLLSAAGTALARTLTSARDPLSGYFACRRRLLDGSELSLRPRGYKILLELLARGESLRVVELPCSFRDRAAGRSKLGLRQNFEFVLQLATLSLYRLRRGLWRQHRGGAAPGPAVDPQIQSRRALGKGGLHA